MPPITKTIQVRRTRHAEHCWRCRDELISDVLLWTPTYGQAKAGRPARTYIQQPCEDTGCNLEDLPEAMNDWEKWRERVRDISAGGTTWWWWSSYFLIVPLHIYIYIYIYVCVCMCVCVCVLSKVFIRLFLHSFSEELQYRAVLKEIYYLYMAPFLWYASFYIRLHKTYFWLSVERHMPHIFYIYGNGKSMTTT